MICRSRLLPPLIVGADCRPRCARLQPALADNRWSVTFPRLHARLHRWHHRDEAKGQCQLARFVAFVGRSPSAGESGGWLRQAVEQSPALRCILGLARKQAERYGIRACAATR